MVARPQDFVGKVIGDHYKVLELIARGGSGSVYKALDTRVDRVVALKILNPFGDAESRQRFEREAGVMARLHHPNLVTFFDCGESEGSSYLAMEFVDGSSLRQLLADGKPLALDDALQIAEQVGGALAYAHRKGIVHRDMKPSNILISGEDGRAVLSDLGLVLPSGNSSLTQTGMVLGSPVYMSPEQIRGERVDPRSDIYSFGIVLYEAYTGRSPFPRKSSLLEEMFQTLKEPAPSPLSFNPAVPARLEKVLLKAIAKSPDERYQSMEDLVTALREGSGVIGEPAVADASRIEPTDLLARVRRARESQAPPRLQPPESPAETTLEELPPVASMAAPAERLSESIRWGPPQAKRYLAVPSLLSVFAVLLGVAGVVVLIWALAGKRGSAGVTAHLLVLPALLTILLFGGSAALIAARRMSLVRRSPRLARSAIPAASPSPPDFAVNAPAPPRPTAPTDETRIRPTDYSAADSSPLATTATISPFREDEPLMPEPSAMAWLYVQSGPQRGRQFRLSDSVVIGRAPACDIVLDEDGVSRQHATIRLVEGHYLIQDQHTTNGTFINGESITMRQLRDRDELRIGNTILRFILAAGPEDLTFEGRRRLREFEKVWEELAAAAQSDE